MKIGLPGAATPFEGETGHVSAVILSRISYLSSADREKGKLGFYLRFNLESSNISLSLLFLLLRLAATYGNRNRNSVDTLASSVPDEV